MGVRNPKDGRSSLESRNAGDFQKSENIGDRWTLQTGPR